MKGPEVRPLPPDEFSEGMAQLHEQLGLPDNGWNTWF